MADDPGDAFAALMNSAAESAVEEAAEAPYGYTTDAKTGELRPKKAPGRPRKQRSLEELKAARAEQEPEPEDRPADRAPKEPKRGRRERPGREASEPRPTPQFREGQISKGINKLYRKAGRILRVWDPVIGQAVVESTRKDEEDDVTVGEAWEELARTNVRIRRFLLSAMTGGAWGQLFMAHAPIMLAVLMKDSIQKRLPFAKLAGALFSGDDDGQDDAGTAAENLADGLQPQDLDAMMNLAAQMMGPMMGGRGFSMPRTVPGDVIPQENGA